jgi:hypothetical protein
MERKIFLSKIVITLKFEKVSKLFKMLRFYLNEKVPRNNLIDSSKIKILILKNE